jgi:type IV pilus assembly protein PilW
MKTERRIIRPRAVRGISTAEVLAGVVLTMILLGGVYSFQKAQVNALAAQHAYNDSQTVTRTAIDLMTRELRMASYDPTGAALPVSPGPSCPSVKLGIVEATGSRLRFQQDLNADGVLTGAGEDVVYDILGDEIRRTDGSSLPVTLVSGAMVGGLSFRYFDGSNPPVELMPSGTPPALTSGQRACTTKVRVRIRASVPNPNPDNPNPLRSSAESEVAIRNRSLMNY